MNRPPRGPLCRAVVLPTGGAVMPWHSTAELLRIPDMGRAPKVTPDNCLYNTTFLLVVFASLCHVSAGAYVRRVKSGSRREYQDHVENKAQGRTGKEAQ